MKLKVIKKVILENDMFWNEEGIFKLADRVRESVRLDFYQTLFSLGEDPQNWDWNYSEELDEESGTGTLIFEGESIDGYTKEA